MRCSTCSADGPDYARFCLQCGTALGRRTAADDPHRAILERSIGVQYEITRLLGRGGMGAVYHAREKALDRPVAIKVLPPDLATDEESRERFRREARTAARLTHPSIVPLHTFGEAEGMLYFVMDYVEGESLGARMKRDGALPPEDVRRIVAELADALDYAHRRGVVHRDIKPDNVLLDRESGRAMLTDFGVARAHASGATLTEAGVVLGTPHYMSPEQASGARELDGRSDLYSLGVMAYAMLAGRLPFPGRSVQEVVMQHITREPPPLSGLAPVAPPEFAAAVMRCLAKEPNHRWPSGAALRNALLAADSDEGDDESPLAMVRSVSSLAALLLAVDGMFAAASYLFPSIRMDEGPWFGLSLILAAVIVAGVGAGAIAARRRGPSWREVLRAMCEPPRWWNGWYPARWRAPHDVWLRLPDSLRRFRIASTVANLLNPPLILTITYGAYGVVTDPGSPWGKWIVNACLVPVTGGLVGIFITVASAHRWGKARGLTGAEVTKAMSTPTSRRAFWRQQKYAALLAAPGDGAPRAIAREPEQPLDYVNAIVAAAAGASGPLRAVFDDAAAAARVAAASIVALGAEVATLARDASPSELEAVDRRLAALGPAEHEPESVAELRRVLVDQRRLLVRLGERMEEASERRERLERLLRTLWLQVATFRANAARESFGAAEVSGAIRAAIEDVRAHADVTASPMTM